MEASNGFLLRNDSEVDDLFVGFLKIVTTCPERSCRHESVVFDPFLSVKVPLASPSDPGEVVFYVTVVPLASRGVPLGRQQVTVAKASCVGDLVEAAAKDAPLARTASGRHLRTPHCALLKLCAGRDKTDEAYRTITKLDYRERVDEVLKPADVLLLYELEDMNALRVLDKRRWGYEGLPRSGDIVVVTTDFYSNSSSKTRLLLREGTRGRVRRIDHDGDAQINFDGIEVSQWVLQNNFDKLWVDLSLDWDERRRTAANKELTLEEQLYDEDSVEEALVQWRESMLPIDDVPCWVVVHFRRLAARTTKNELYGVPALVCVSRYCAVEALAGAVRDELMQRYGPSVGRHWRLLQATGMWDVTSTHALIWDEGQQQGTERLACPPEYLVVEWAIEGEQSEPPEVTGCSELAEPAEDAAPDLTVNRCFRWVTEMEQVSEEDTIYCSGCKSHQRCFKKLDFWSLPPVLVLQLKRFEYTGLGGGRKDTTPVCFPLEGLDLREFSPSGMPSFPRPCLRAGRCVTITGLKAAAAQSLNGQQGTVMYLDTASSRFCVRLNEDDPVELWKKIKPDNLAAVDGASGGDSSASPADAPAVYDLVSVSKHVGCSSFGHYVAYARSSEDGLWRLFDDEDVTEVAAEEVQAQQKGAYVLFYLRRDLRPACWGEPAAPAEGPS
jgi:hypothetical protein